VRLFRLKLAGGFGRRQPAHLHMVAPHWGWGSAYSSRVDAYGIALILPAFRKMRKGKDKLYASSLNQIMFLVFNLFSTFV